MHCIALHAQSAFQSPACAPPPKYMSPSTPGGQREGRGMPPASPSAIKTTQLRSIPASLSLGLLGGIPKGGDWGRQPSCYFSSPSPSPVLAIVSPLAGFAFPLSLSDPLAGIPRELPTETRPRGLRGSSAPKAGSALRFPGGLQPPLTWAWPREPLRVRPLAPPPRQPRRWSRGVGGGADPSSRPGAA